MTPLRWWSYGFLIGFSFMVIVVCLAVIFYDVHISIGAHVVHCPAGTTDFIVMGDGSTSCH